MKSILFKTAGMTLLVAGMAGLCLAQCISNICPGGGGVPEINASTAGNALALLSGAVLMIRGRKK